MKSKRMPIKGYGKSYKTSTHRLPVTIDGFETELSHFTKDNNSMLFVYALKNKDGEFVDVDTRLIKGFPVNDFHLMMKDGFKIVYDHILQKPLAYAHLINGCKKGKKTVYIGSKVTGEDYQQCVKKFRATQDFFEGLNYNVINPMDIVPKDTPWHIAMDMLKPELLKADILLVLPDWQQSEGTKIEMELAKQHGIEIVFYDQVPAAPCFS